jgi:hypothetical protein
MPPIIPPRRAQVQRDIQSVFRSFPGSLQDITVRLREPAYDSDYVQEAIEPNAAVLYHGEALYVPQGSQVGMEPFGFVATDAPQFLVAGERRIPLGARVTTNGLTFEVLDDASHWQVFTLIKVKQLG